MSFPKRGEVYFVSLDPIIGAEIGKIRPALVISNNVNNQYADTVTVLPITSKIIKVYPFEVLIKKGKYGLTKDSKVKCSQIRTIDKKRLIKHVGTLEDIEIKKVENALLIHLGISCN